MKTKFLFLVSLLFATAFDSIAQSTTVGNTGFFSDYLGWNATTTFDLNIKHEANRPIIFSTNNLERMRLLADGRWLVGLSTSSNTARLQILDNSSSGVGIRSRASGSSSLNIGGWFTGNGGQSGVGAYGLAGNTAASENYGVYGEACNAPTNYAIYGTVCEANDNWAGYFVGKTTDLI